MTAEWSKCKCSRQHTSTRGFLKCKIRHARWVTGDGEWALVSWCNAPTITLWPNHAEALDAQNLLHAIRCGTQCRGNHQIVHLLIREDTQT